MPRKKLVALVLVVAMVVSFALVGCGKSTSGPKGQELRIWVGSEPETLDPNRSTGLPEANYELALYEGLTVLDAKEKPVPAVAERWDVSPDGMKYTFYIRPNAKWSNGDPVTAYDFEYSWKRALSPELASEYAYFLFPIKNAESYNAKKATADQVGVKALNDKTLEVVLEKPTPHFLLLTAFHTLYPVHKKTVEANGDKWATDVKTLIGNGPFKLANWVHNNKLEMVPNEHYWDKGKIKLTKLTYILTEEQTTALSLYENNQLDFVDTVPPSEVPRLKKEGKLIIAPELSTYFVCFQNEKAPFNDPRVRKAFSLAIDRNAIVKNVTKTEEAPAYAWVPYGLNNPATGNDFRKEGGDYFTEDVALAKKLLAEAGYPDGKGFPEVTYIYNTQERHKAIAEALQEMWKKNLGVNVKIQNMEWKVFLKVRHQGDYQIARHGWVGDYPDPMTFMDMWIKASGNNDAKYYNPEYERLIDVAQSTGDQKVRMQAMHDAEKILMEDMAIAPIFFYTKPYMAKPYVKGYYRNTVGPYNVREAYIEK